jgi:hypothetical protein
MTRTLRRMIGASVLIVLLTCGALSIAAIETVGTVADLLAKGGFVKSADLHPVGADSPTTFLILGSDQRDKGAVDYSSSSTSTRARVSGARCRSRATSTSSGDGRATPTTAGSTRPSRPAA